MAVPNTDAYVQYSADGTATVFAIPFKLLKASDLTVQLDGSSMSYGYTVSGIGNNTATITFASAPSGQLLLVREIPFERLTDYQTNGDLLAKTVNNDFDRLWCALQDLLRGYGRALVRPFFKNYFDAEGYRIANLGDPVADQDATNMRWSVNFFTDLLNRVSGNTNSTTGIFYDGGTLFDFLQIGVQRTVTSIAALRALRGNTNRRAFVLGYYNPGDGGGGIYVYDAADTASADNGGTVIVATDGGRWKLQFTNFLSVAQFGVMGSGYGDIAPVITLASSILYAQRGGGRVNLGAASYAQTSTASLYPEVAVHGVATDNSRIEFTASNKTAFASFRPAGYVPRLMFRHELHNMTINSSSGKSSNCIGLDLTDLRQFSVTGVVFANFMRGLYFNKRGVSSFPGGEVFFGKVFQCHFASCGYSITFGGAANRNTFELNTYTNCDHAYDFSQGNNYSETNTFINENIEGCKNWAEWPGGTIYSQTWIGLIIENPTSNGFSCTVKDPGRQVFLNLSLIPSGNAAALDFYKLNDDWSDRFGTKASSNPDLYGTFISEELRMSKGIRNFGMYGSTSYSGTLAQNGGAILSITVTGVSPGDVIKASANKDLQGCSLVAWCSATNTVNVRIHNQSNTSITLTDVSVRAVVERFG